MRSFIVLLTLFVVGCAGTQLARKQPTIRPAAHPGQDEPELTPIPPFALAVSEDAIVRVLAPSATCSGTLVEDDLVLTAHHCVVQRGQRGEYTKSELTAQDVSVELGGDYLPWGTIGVKDIVTPPCGEAGGVGDIAVLVLDRKLVGITPMPARLDDPPRVGENIDPAGFGRCALSPDGIHRAIRPGGPISEVNPGFLRVTASICPGDSGGPVFARGTHRVVGVVSESAMDSDERTVAPTIIARVDAFRAVFNHARLIADGLHKNELPPISCAK